MKQRLPQKIVIVGHVCIDHNVIEGQRVDSWGSPAMYMAKYFTDKLGIRTDIVSHYGKDFLPYTAGLHFSEEPNDLPTMVYENIVVHGKRTRKCHHSENSLPVQPSARIDDLMAASDVCIVASILSNYSAEYVKRMLKKVPKTSLRMLAPQGHFRVIQANGSITTQRLQEPERVLPLFDVVAISDEDIENALEEAMLWSEMAPQTAVVVTQAERGATVFMGGVATAIPTTPIADEDLTSPVGCGDLFLAQLALALHTGLDIYKSVTAANQAMYHVLKRSGSTEEF